MTEPNKNPIRKIKPITGFWVAAFQYPAPSCSDEFDFIEGPGNLLLDNGEWRTLVEFTLNSVPSLVYLAEMVSKHRNLSWRLLKFDESGLQEVNKDEYLRFMHREHSNIRIH